MARHIGGKMFTSVILLQCEMIKEKNVLLKVSEFILVFLMFYSVMVCQDTLYRTLGSLNVCLVPKLCYLT